MQITAELSGVEQEDLMEMLNEVVDEAKKDTAEGIARSTIVLMSQINRWITEACQLGRRIEADVNRAKRVRINDE